MGLGDLEDLLILDLQVFHLAQVNLYLQGILIFQVIQLYLRVLANPIEMNTIISNSVIIMLCCCKLLVIQLVLVDLVLHLHPSVLMVPLVLYLHLVL